MSDLEIIKEIEKEYGLDLEEVEKINGNSKYQYVQKSGIVTHLNLHRPITRRVQNQMIFITNLKNLTHLYLSRFTVVEFSAINKLKKLVYLNIKRSFIKDTYFFSKLTNLTHLELSSSHIQDITPLKDLNNLTHLHLGSNRIQDITTLKNLNNLTFLSLRSNLIQDITALNNLDNLTYLNLGLNQIQDLSQLKNLKRLINLYLGDNNIIDPSPLIHLHELKHLRLDNNNFSDISFVKKLKKLSSLKLQHNPIQKIPKEIISLNLEINWDDYRYDNSISFFNNPIKSPPLEIVKQGKEAMVRYFERIEEEGEDFIYEAKVILVGEGSAGKTSLQKRLLNQNDNLPELDKRTRGIQINDWNFKKEKDKNHVAHIWDFGGQDVYYPVHRFFITENSLFILLASTRQTHHNFDYWIPTIYQFGGTSPIILGQTCHDGNKISWNDLGVFLGNENFNIIKTQAIPYYELNLPNKNEGLNKISITIKNQILDLPHYGRSVPTSWVKIRNKINAIAEKNPCITYDKFKEICLEANENVFKVSADFSDCCQFLHDTGVLLWYSKIEDLKNWVILQPEWAMNAVYIIIDDAKIQERRGNILANDFKRLWCEEAYEEKHPILKKMLETFKIAFPKKHKTQDYIIPARLLSMPNENRWNDDKPCLRLEYNYKFMPRGMVNQVSAELSRHISNNDEVWNNAVNLNFINNETKGQIEEDFYNRKITIKARGRDARSLVILAQDAIQNITSGYRGVEAEIIVPCSCDECVNSDEPTTFKYEKLIDWSTKKEYVTCNESDERLKINELLYNVGLQNPQKKTKENKKSKKIFVSYSKHDKDYLQDFEDHTITLKSEGLAAFNCQMIDFGDEWDERIKREIDECDIMVCLVSAKFLNTDYITKIEIPKAIEQNKMIIPIIIKACDWENSEIGKYQAAQRGKILSLDENFGLNGKIKAHTNEEKDAFWTEIIKEFRQKIFN